MNEIPTLLNEIFLYIDQKFDSPKVTIIQEDDMITLYAKKDDEILLEKRLMFLVNKYDLINDTEILEEYKKQFFEDIIAFFKSKKIGTKITKTALKKNTFTISAATHLGIDTWLTYLVELLKNTDANEVYHIPE
jgi:50S ribosomal subunit-associated GTPase HflX